MSHYDAEIDNAGFEKQRWIIEQLGHEELTVFDIGGNIGQSIDKYLKSFPHCRIYSFEPHPLTFETLKERFTAVDGVYCEQLALGMQPGKASFCATKCAEASSLLPPEKFVMELSPNRNYDYTQIEVKIDTIDRVAKRFGVNSIDVLKIDVQGAELDVLRGAEALLCEKKIEVIFSESLIAEHYSGQSEFSDLWIYLRSFGYVMWDFFPFLHTKNGRLWAANAIFISPSTMQRIDPH